MTDLIISYKFRMIAVQIALLKQVKKKFFVSKISEILGPVVCLISLLLLFFSAFWLYHLVCFSLPFSACPDMLGFLDLFLSFWNLQKTPLEPFI